MLFFSQRQPCQTVPHEKLSFLQPAALPYVTVLSLVTWLSHCLHSIPQFIIWEKKNLLGTAGTKPKCFHRGS